MKRVLLIVCLLCAAQMGSVSEVYAATATSTVQARPKARKATTRKASRPQVKIALAGTTYAGDGNTAGTFITVTIHFKENGKCVCVSDFYRMFDEPEAVDGTYVIKNGKVIVTCQPEGFGEPIKWRFAVEDNGKLLSHNQSDTSRYGGGSMGKDFLFLEKQ